MTESGHDWWADELANLFAYHRNRNAVYMDGSHNPRPSEEKAARGFVDRLRADERIEQAIEARSEKVGKVQADERERNAGLSDFERWWESYWTNRTDTVEHTISRSIAYDAWWAARRNARGDT